MGKVKFSFCLQTLLVATCSLFSIPAMALSSCPGGEGDPCAPQQSPAISQAKKPASNVQNPINLITGNKYQREVDYEASGGIASLVLRRHYNTLNTQTDNGLGLGWSHSFDLRLLSHPDKKKLQINQADGRRIIFKLDVTSEVYRAVSPSDGLISLTKQGPTWYLSDGRRIIFKRMYPVKILFPGNRGFTLEYQGKPYHKTLSRVTDHQGRVLTFHYTQGDTALASFDQKTSSTIKLAGHLESVTLPSGGVMAYHYDTDHNLSKVDYPDGTSRVYHYDNVGFPNYLTGITNRSGKRYATWDYDDEGRANFSSHANGTNKATLEYHIPEKSGDVGTTYVTNSLGQKSTYTWKFYPRAGQSLLISSEGPGCSNCPIPNRQYTYNNHYQLETITDTKTQAVTRYTYDKLGRTLKVTATEGENVRNRGGVSEILIARYEYEGNLPRPILIARPSVNPKGEHRTEITYNTDLLPISLTEKGFSPKADEENTFEAIERTTKLSYTKGNLSTIDGPRADVEDLIHLSYDQNNRLQSLTQADGQTLKVLAYDVNGHPTKIKKGTQNPLSINYDAQGQIKTIAQRNRHIQYNYDKEGRLTQINTLMGEDMTNSIQMTYDDAGRLESLNDDKGREIQQIHDSESRPTTTKLMGSNGSVLNTISYLYDAQGRLDKTQSQNLDGESETDYQYDEKGQFTKVEKNGQAVSLSYNNLGQLLGLTQPGEVVTQFSYDNKGQSTALTDARDNKTQTIKDDFGRVVQHISPDTGTNLYAYDKAGNRVKRTDPEGTVTTYQWSKANKLVQKLSQKHPEPVEGLSAELTTFEYDKATGKLASTANPNTTESFKYNREGQLIAHTRKIDTHSFTTEYEYNEFDQLKRKTLPDGQTLRYHYYTANDGKPKQIGKLRAITRESLFGLKQENIISEIDNDKTDNQTSYLSHNGLKTQYEFREDGQLKNIQIADTLKLQYSYDQNGNITGIDENGTLQSYAYDQGRLTFADTTKGQYWYTYDSLGNRTQKVHATKAGNILDDKYQYPEKTKGNHLTALTVDNLYQLADQSKQYQYNQNGSPINNDEFSYKYNSDQRPTHVYKTKDGNKRLLAEYAYNTFGERIKKTIYNDSNESNTTYFFYDLQILAGKANQQGEITTEYLYLNRKPVAKLEKDKTYAIHADHRNAPRTMTDDNKQTVWQADYSPFGEISIEKQTAQLQLRLPGQYEDNETGTYYNYLRDYNPKTGRYITSDPLSTSAGLNTYAYVKNDPLNRVDPLGLFDELIHYYMTYFLAVVAGLPEDKAKTIAMATQFIDDNSKTTSMLDIGPVPYYSNVKAMSLYHFVLNQGDRNDDNPLTRFKHPSSYQLDHLSKTAMYYSKFPACENTKAQFYGEYLHAYEDSFAHRDKNNVPYQTWGGPGGYGHTLGGHSPDYTYNQSKQEWKIRYDKPLPGGGFAKELVVTDKWLYNERRTLALEIEVYEKLKNDFCYFQCESVGLKAIAGDGDSKIGRNTLDPEFTPVKGKTGVLQEFNAYNENLPNHSPEKKIDILNKWLLVHNFHTIPKYVKDDAKKARIKNLNGIIVPKEHADHVILETD